MERPNKKVYLLLTCIMTERSIEGVLAMMTKYKPNSVCVCVCVCAHTHTHTHIGQFQRKLLIPRIKRRIFQMKDNFFLSFYKIM